MQASSDSRDSLVRFGESGEAGKRKVHGPEVLETARKNLDHQSPTSFLSRNGSLENALTTATDRGKLQQRSAATGWTSQAVDIPGAHSGIVAQLWLHQGH